MSSLRVFISKQATFQFLPASHHLTLSSSNASFAGVNSQIAVTASRLSRPFSSNVNGCIKRGPAHCEGRNQFLKVSTILQLSPASRGFQLTSMASSQSGHELKAEHEPQNNRFVVRIGKEKALLEYQQIHPGVLEMYHTEVPVKLRGQAIGQILAKAAFDYVVQNDLKMKLTCTYLQDYFVKHSDEKLKNHLYHKID